MRQGRTGDAETAREIGAGERLARDQARDRLARRIAERMKDRFRILGRVRLRRWYREPLDRDRQHQLLAELESVRAEHGGKDDCVFVFQRRRCFARGLLEIGRSAAP
jgi:hypothetical protein